MALSNTSIFLGRGSILGLALETTYGTAVNPTTAVKLISGQITTEIENVPRPHLHGGVGRVAEGYYVESEDYTITAEVEAGFDTVGLLLRGAMGPAPSTSGAGPYVHPFILGDVLPSITMRVHRGTATGSLTGRYTQLTSCIINSLTLSIQAGSLPRLRFEAFAKAATYGNQTGLTVLDTTPVLYHQAGNLAWNSASYDCNSFDLTINNGIARRRNIGSLQTLYPHPSALREVMVAITRDNVDEDFLAALIASTESDLEIDITGTGNNLIELALHSARVKGPHTFAVSEGGHGAIPETVEFVPRNDRTGTDYGLALTLTNDNASYLT